MIQNAALNKIWNMLKQSGNTLCIYKRPFDAADTKFCIFLYLLAFNSFKINQKPTLIDNLRPFHPILQYTNWLMYNSFRFAKIPVYICNLKVFRIFYFIFLFVLFFMSHDSYFIGYAQRAMYVLALLLQLSDKCNG